MNEELLMRALRGRATDAEQIVVDAWRAASPEHARHLRELQQTLDDVEAWYRATPLRAPPGAATLIRRAELRQAPDDGLLRRRPESGTE